MHYFSDLFEKVPYMFRTGRTVRHQEYLNTVCTAVGICRASSVGCLQTANRTSTTNTYLLCIQCWNTRDDGQYDLSETCRVLYRINQRNSASRWLLLYKNGPLCSSLFDRYLSRSFLEVTWTDQYGFFCYGYASSPCVDSVWWSAAAYCWLFCRLGEKNLPICRDVRKSFA